MDDMLLLHAHIWREHAKVESIVSGKGSVMKSKELAQKLLESRLVRNVLKWWSRLQVRMTVSYVGVSLVIALLLELLVLTVIFFVLTRSPLVNDLILNTAQRTARLYALDATVQSGGIALDSNSTFQPGQPSSLDVSENVVSQSGRSLASSWLGEIFSERVPYINSSPDSAQAVSFALLITPNGQVLASSYPVRYAISMRVAQLLPAQSQLILHALKGQSGSNIVDSAQGSVASAAQTIWSKDKKPLGAVYVEVPSGLINGQISSNIYRGWLSSGFLWLLFMIPIGSVFGFITTRGLVKRVHHLVQATEKVANGDYTQRVPSTKQDEIGQLESQFNSMAEQLDESIAEQKRLVEQHARQEERARIEQELRTAQNIQRSLLPKENPEFPGWQIATHYQAAREVGGDLYDFLFLADGRLGLVIGDVADKGMAAALVMASTRSMLRAAAQATDSPGEALARVNELLYVDTPPMMFVTCFYAILDLSSGKLRYANAGHDLPYVRHANSVHELHATGMPLGLMPGMRYEEQEVTIGCDENILFYTDGLVEAHNAKREMFGFPRLQTLLAEYSDGTSLINFLLHELKGFTGEGWEQEDDLTLLAVRRKE